MDGVSVLVVFYISEVVVLSVKTVNIHESVHSHLIT